MEVLAPPFPLPHPGYVAGRWIKPFSVHQIGAGSALSNGNVRLLPFYVPSRLKIDRIGVRVTTLFAGGNVRCGIYRHDAALGKPIGAPLCDSGNMSTSAADLVEGTVDLTMEPGWYWAGVNSDNTTAALQTCLSAIPLVAMLCGTPTRSVTNDAAATSRAVAQFTSAFGAMPTLTDGGVTWGTSTGTGVIDLRTA